MLTLHNIKGTPSQIEYLYLLDVIVSYALTKSVKSGQSSYSITLKENSEVTYPKFNTLLEIKKWCEEQDCFTKGTKVVPLLFEGDSIELIYGSHQQLNIGTHGLLKEERSLYKKIYDANEEIVVVEVIEGTFERLSGYYLSFISKEHEPFKVGNSHKPFLFSPEVFQGVAS